MHANKIAAIHQSPLRLVLAIAGGASRAISELLNATGASATVLEAIVPYHQAALSEYLGSTPESFASVDCARKMAMVAYQRGNRYVEFPHEATGIGVSASLASDRPKKGLHRLHVAIQTKDLSHTYSIEFCKDKRDRAEEECLSTQLLLEIIYSLACGFSLKVPELMPGEAISEESHRASKPMTMLLAKELNYLVMPGYHQCSNLVFPGAFNPFHNGHRAMVQYAESLLNRKVTLEIAIANVDKPPIDFIEMNRRYSAINGEYPMVFSNMPTFEEKALHLPATTFIIGFDTIQRIIEPRYYGNSESKMKRALETIRECGSRFLVFGRVGNTGFSTLADIELPVALKEICIEVAETEFRSDLSSSEMR
jgi:nicotinamide mononucleotide (NMN) deamidase PncC